MMTQLERLSIFDTCRPQTQKQRKIQFRRTAPRAPSPLRKPLPGHAKRPRTDQIDLETLASNAACYALCASLFPILNSLEKPLQSASASAANGVLDAMIEAAESSLGPDAPVMSPLTELFETIEHWQREHLVDDVTLLEVLLARVSISVKQTAGIELGDVLRRPFAKAFDGLPPSLRT